MQCVCNFVGRLPSWLRRLLPTIVLVVLAVLAGATDIFSHTVHEVVNTSFREYLSGFLPHIAKMLVIALLANLAWLGYHPVCKGFQRVLDKSTASDRGKQFAVKVLKLVYWAVIVFFVLSWFASEFMGKFVLGFSVLGAALTLALQGAANDFICGVLMQFSHRVRAGDEIQTIGLDVSGQVIDVGYLSTQIQGADGVITVPNREVWGRATKVKKAAPKKSLLILPSGYDADRPAK